MVTSIGGTFPRLAARCNICLVAHRPAVTILQRTTAMVSGRYPIDDIRLAIIMPGNNYDPDALTRRAALWRLEAEVATLQEMRVFCLHEADQCERRANLSRNTPVLSEAAQSRLGSYQRVG
jgi:hypothetical protein